MITSRFLRTLAANAYGQLITVLIQVGTVPVYLTYWSAEKYGIWLMLFALPSYLVASDAGVGLAGANKALMLARSGDQEQAEAVFQTTAVFLILVAGMLCVIGGLATGAALLAGFTTQVVVAGYILCLVSATNVISGLIDTALRTNSLFAESAFYLNTVRLAEAAGGIVGLVAGGGFVHVALGLLIPRVLLTVLAAILVSKKHPFPKWGCRLARLNQFRELLRPGVSFVLFPIGNAFLYQGFVLVVGAMLNPLAVVVFTCYRTMSRAVTQVLAVVNKSYWPEFTEAYADNDAVRLTTLMRMSGRTNMLVVIATSICCLAIGESLIRYWTRGAVPYDELYFGLMVLSTVLTGLWQSYWVALMATNQHSRFSAFYLCGAILVLPFAALLIFAVGQEGAAYTLIAHEIALIVGARFCSRTVYVNKYALAHS